MSAGYGLPFEDNRKKDIVEASKQPETVTDVPSITVILLSGEELMTTDPSTCTNIIELKRGILIASRRRGLDWSPKADLELIPAEWVDIVRTRQVQALCDPKAADEKAEEVKALIKKHVVRNRGTTLDMHNPPYEGSDINADLEEIAKNCPHLQQIWLYGTALTDDGLKEAAPHMKNLKELFLHDTRVTDTGLKDIAIRWGKNVAFINLSNTKVTDAGLKEIAKNCPNLKEAWLQNTSITDAGLKELCKICTKLKRIGGGKVRSSQETRQTYQHIMFG